MAAIAVPMRRSQTKLLSTPSFSGRSVCMVKSKVFDAIFDRQIQPRPVRGSRAGHAVYSHSPRRRAGVSADSRDFAATSGGAKIGGLRSIATWSQHWLSRSEPTRSDLSERCTPKLPTALRTLYTSPTETARIRGEQEDGIRTASHQGLGSTMAKERLRLSAENELPDTADREPSRLLIGKP